MSLSNNFLIGLLLSAALSTSAYAESSTGYYFRYVYGYSKINYDKPPETEVEEEEEEDDGLLDRYDPANIGEVGNDGICKDMLIVSESQLRAAVSNETYQVRHEESGEYYTFEDGPLKIFTGQVNNMSGLFMMKDFRGDLGYWNVSRVTNMSSMFSDNSYFTSGISGWDVSNVTNMASMFDGAAIFGRDLSRWDVSNVTDMSRMFYSAGYFTSDISGWDVSNVTDMTSIFHHASSFLHDLSCWDTSKVKQIPDYGSAHRGWMTDMQPPLPGTPRPAHCFN